jgi:hypothetical protein
MSCALASDSENLRVMLQVLSTAYLCRVQGNWQVILQALLTTYLCRGEYIGWFEGSM